MGMKVIWVPTKVSQKCHWLSRSFIMRPVAFGNQ